MSGNHIEGEHAEGGTIESISATFARLERRNLELETHLRALVDSCTPRIGSQLPGETKVYGATAPNKDVLEAARKVLQP